MEIADAQVSESIGLCCAVSTAEVMHAPRAKCDDINGLRLLGTDSRNEMYTEL